MQVYSQNYGAGAVSPLPSSQFVSTTQFWSQIPDSRAAKGIERAVAQVVSDLKLDRLPFLEASYKKNGILFRKRVDFGAKGSRTNFSLQLHLMEKVYSLIGTGRRATKRDLYYEDVRLYGKQAKFDNVLVSLANYLKVPRVELNIDATPKGVVAGNLDWTLPNGQEVQINSLDAYGTNLIPTNLEGHHNFRSDAQFILVVEKDAIFRKLLEEDCFGVLGSFILITGKGYPDYGTRRLVNLLATNLRIPCFALVDADAYGIDIAATYRYGSQGPDLIDYNAPDIILLGLLPSEMMTMTASEEYLLDLTDGDRRKLMKLQERIPSEDWRREIRNLLEIGKKAELEILTTNSFGYLTHVYLYAKINELLHQEEEEFIVPF